MIKKFSSTAPRRLTWFWCTINLENQLTDRSVDGLVFTVLYFSCGICECDWFEGQRHFIFALLALCSLQLIRLCANVQQFQELQLNLQKAAFSFICIHSVDLSNARLSLKIRYANLLWARPVLFYFYFFLYCDWPRRTYTVEYSQATTLGEGP